MTTDKHNEAEVETHFGRTDRHANTSKPNVILKAGSFGEPVIWHNGRPYTLQNARALRDDLTRALDEANRRTS